MPNSLNMIIDQALVLNPIERANISEKLLFSLDKPDPTIDALWGKEADSRIEKYKKNKMESISSKEVFSKYKKA